MLYSRNLFKHRLMAAFLLVLMLLSTAVSPILAATVPWYNPAVGAPQAGAGSGGGGAYGECAPRGFSVRFNEASGDYAEGYHGWLSSTYSNAAYWPVYVGEEGKNGVAYIDPTAAVTFYVWVDKNPTADGNVETNKQFIEFYQDGVSYRQIEGLNLAIGNPVRDSFADPSGQVSVWYIPITVTGLEEGHNYAFALLRGFKTNNRITLVLAQDGKGYYSSDASTDAELNWYDSHKYDEYLYRRPNFDFDIENPVTTGTATATIPTNDEGSLYPFRFGFSTGEAEDPGYDPDPPAQAYTAQGHDQTLRLYTPNTATPHPDVSALRLADSYIKEGAEYFLNRVDVVHDISGGKDVQIQAYFTAGMNAWSESAWKVNGMRYMSVLDADTGRVVANWRDEAPDAAGKNSSGAYQIGYGLPAGFTGANQAGILYTIPNAAFSYSKRYYVVFGSATCGNNNQKMLYAPIIFRITTSDQDGGGSVENSANPLVLHNISLNVIKSNADSVSRLQFNRYTGSGYSPGNQIFGSIAGQEIAIADTAGTGLTSSWRILDEYGEVVPTNGFEGGGSNASPFGDVRFTMPNSAVTVNVVFGYKAVISVTDGTSAIDGAGITVQDSQRAYAAEKDGSYVLPGGEYSYTATAEGFEAKTGSFTVAGNETIDIVFDGGEPDPGVPYGLQGFNQNARLNAPLTNAMLQNVSVLQNVASFVPVREGDDYFLNRIGDVYDVREDVRLQVYFGNGG
ncbi:MAG: carboxypeptidase-like regulatory domain-containing protein, partial [Peptococcaceae bacterium]|nr:carboxypeptidase-like regulatory domain-containing protein [Peptococcaceae bacterium]